MAITMATSPHSSSEPYKYGAPAVAPHSLSTWALEFHDGWKQEGPQQRGETGPTFVWAPKEAKARGAEEEAAEGMHHQLRSSDGHRPRS